MPLLALVALIAPAAAEDSAPSSGFPQFLKALGDVAALLVAGRYLLNPFFRLLALTGARDR